ncbi:MAG: fucose isomerase [Sphaerochaeta sp.]|nr:fucose isomerase [Sphaerochaeta sp.]
MKHRVTLGLVCLARDTYDYKAAKEIYDRQIEHLLTLEAIDWVVVPDLVFSVDEAQAAAESFASGLADAVVVISGTFHLGHLVLQIRKTCSRPILLWGWPELPYNGGKIRLNSVCGVNLNASNLYKAGIDDYHVCIHQEIDEVWIDAIRVIVALRHAHVGIAGFRAHGFFNLSVQDNKLFADTGVILDHYELSDIHTMAVEDSEVERRRNQLREIFEVSTLSAFQLAKVAELSAKLDAFFKMHALTALAVRCWPEFARDFGVSPCAAMSLLQSENLILACEGDVEGALSMIAQRALGAQTPFLFDFSQVDFEENHALFWHCGVAPCNLWDGVCVRSLDTYFAGGKGVTADFVLKSGELSVTRIDSARGEYRLFLQSCRAVPMEKLLKGTYMKVLFDRPVREVLDLVVDNGLAHHSSVVYGNFLAPMRLVAKLLGWRVIE